MGSTTVSGIGLLQPVFDYQSVYAGKFPDRVSDQREAEH
jgi:hypothetical protein